MPFYGSLSITDNHGDVLEELNEEVRKGILKSMRPEKLAALAEGMDVDDVAEVLRTLPDSAYQNVLKLDGLARQKSSRKSLIL